MSKYSKKCGIEANDNYDDYSTCYISGRKVNYRYHTITGKGKVQRCSASSIHNYEDAYAIEEGITELGDNCFSKSSISRISLPNTLEIIGNSCFRNSNITSITLPKTLKKIGHTNFPSSLTYLNIPPLIEDFNVDNVADCTKMMTINVDEKNTKYKSVDGILYNYDLTEILYCPNAKTGKVIIPNTVKSIANRCFQGCKSLKTVIIPPSVEHIGENAFFDSVFDNLRIPNSVKTVGSGCFKKIVIKESLNFSSQIRIFPDECFKESEINKFIFSFCNVTEIGNQAIGDIKRDIIPSNVSFESLKHLGISALNYCNETEVFEFSSCLEKIDDDAFQNTHKNVKLSFFSSSPIRLSPNAFRGLSDNATLIVPPGSKLIFQNATPWNTISNICESELDVEYNENGDKVMVSDERHLKRLKSVADSKIKADRYFLKEIIEDICQDYLYVDCDDEFEKALEVIKYNRSFSPAIIPNLEQSMYQNWINKYKIKLASKIVFESSISLATMADNESYVSLPKIETLTLPAIDVTPVLPETSAASTQVVFNEDIQKHLQNILTLTKKDLKIAVSWFTNYSLFKQVKELAECGIKVQLITNNDLTNNGGYCLNLNELINAGVEISLIEYPHLLHHKFCIIDDCIIVNGSYNWTRFSAKNYENITIIHNDADTTEAFTEEFDRLLLKAEHKCIKEMPEFVPEHPEYDRSAFRQYVTEELDAEARETSIERDKITALQKAASLNSEYLEKINPDAKKNYGEAFKTIKESVSMQNKIAAMVEEKPIPVAVTYTTNSNSTTNSTITATRRTLTPEYSAVVTRANQQAVEKVKASSLFIVLDVSASMDKTYKAGHVHSITKKALSASLAITNSKEVSLWTFGNNAEFVDNIGIDSISKINKVQCKNEGTELKKFVETADSSIKDDALVIIFTDDDSASIASAISAMQNRDKVFWQIIVYDVPLENITKSISNVTNTSVVSLTDYNSKEDEEISEVLLKEYINWKKTKQTF